MNTSINKEADQSTVNIAPARFVTVKLAAHCTGLTPAAIRTKMTKGIWAEGREYVRRAGSVFVDLKGYEKWVAQAE